MPTPQNEKNNIYSTDWLCFAQYNCVFSCLSFHTFCGCQCRENQTSLGISKHHALFSENEAEWEKEVLDFLMQ
jgi:hypothetical protein